MVGSMFLCPGPKDQTSTIDLQPCPPCRHISPDSQNLLIMLWSVDDEIFKVFTFSFYVPQFVDAVFSLFGFFAHL